jgi:CheY-like chemotaxis protein
MSALRKNVLVVDDDPVVARSIDRVLSDRGYAVITAADGPEALRKLSEAEYDVVFTDIRMPGMDGIEVAERVKARRPWVPVVIITGYGTQDNEARARAAGVTELLHKPLSPEMIEASARKALEAPQAATPAVSLPAAAAPSLLKWTGLLVAAPFIGLVFAVAFPFIGLAMLAWMGAKAFWKRSGRISRFGKNVALFLAAPFIGLAYIIAFPFVGVALLAWTGARMLRNR